MKHTLAHICHTQLNRAAQEWDQRKPETFRRPERDFFLASIWPLELDLFDTLTYLGRKSIYITLKPSRFSPSPAFTAFLLQAFVVVSAI